MNHLRFVQYRAEEMAFRRNNNIPGEKHNFQISPQIKIELKLEKENYFIIMTAKVESTEEKPSPFDFSVKLFAHFLIIERADIETLRQEGTAFLYPYLRSTVSSLVTSANMPPYFLPVIDMKLTPGTVEEKKDDGEIKITPLVDGDQL